MLHRIKMICLMAKNVVKVSLQNKVMYGLLLLSLVFISMAHLPFVMKELQGFRGITPLNMAIEIGFFYSVIFLFLIVVFVLFEILQNQLEPEKMLLILSKPIRRGEMLLGITLGLVEILFFNWLVITSGLWLTVCIHTKQLNINIFLGTGIVFLIGIIFLSLIITIYTFIPTALSGILAFLICLGSFGIANASSLIHWIRYPYLTNVSKIIFKCLPRIVPLLAVAMNTLKISSINVNPVIPILHTLILIIILNLIGFIKFNRVK